MKLDLGGMSHEELVGLVVEFLAETRSFREANTRLVAENAALRAEVAELRRRLDSDSSNSSRPPSSDSPYTKPVPKASGMRGRSGRRPGKQPGANGTGRALVDDPDEVIDIRPEACADCGGDLSGAADLGMRRYQVVEVLPPPPPRVTEYRVFSRGCRCCGKPVAGIAPAFARAPVSLGPSVKARAVWLTVGQHVPFGRAVGMLEKFCGVSCSVGAIAAARVLAAKLLEPFMAHVRVLLHAAEVLHADETPARAAGALRYVHVACNEAYTAMHTGGRAIADIDAGGVLPGFTGVIVRDGCAGYRHLTEALHAWCGAHLLRDLKAVHDGDPDGQLGALAMGDTLHLMLNDTHAARQAGADRIDADKLAHHLACYHGATAQIRADNAGAGTVLKGKGLTLAKRFEEHEDMILLFLHDLAVPFTNNRAEQEIRGVKTRQRVSGCWRTLTGLADFAVIWSYLATAAKWGLDHIEALTMLFTSGPWLPPAPTALKLGTVRRLL